MLCWSVGAGACDRRLQNARFKFSILQHEQSVSFNCRLMTINECCFTIISILFHEEDVFCRRGSEQRKLSVQKNTSHRGLKQAFYFVRGVKNILWKLLQYSEGSYENAYQHWYTLGIYYDGAFSEFCDCLCLYIDVKIVEHQSPLNTAHR